MGENLLNPRHEVICSLLASGHSIAKVAEVTGSDRATIQSLIEDERFQFELKALKLKLFGKVDASRRFKDMVPAAQDVVADVLENPNTKAGLKFAAAQEIFDRALGKPKQSIEHSGSLVAAVFDKLDREKVVIDVGATPIENNGQAEQNIPLDSIDAWAQENL